jgi:phosphohistidine phosphatase
MVDHTLALLRHAKSDWTAGRPDVDRPLARRGRRQAPEAGRWIAGHLDPPGLAVVSPAQRARASWDLVAAALPVAPPARFDDRLYDATDRDLLAVVQGLPEDVGTAVLVGHNPGLEALVALLTGEWIAMPTSGLAVVALPGPWAEAGPLRATLTAYGRPPEDGPA